jgi:hypothetical protein
MLANNVDIFGKWKKLIKLEMTRVADPHSFHPDPTL